MYFFYHILFYSQELLPFLTDGVDDEEEVLAAIAISLGKLIPYVGGSEHIKSLLPPMELLLSVGKSLFSYLMQASLVQTSSDNFAHITLNIIQITSQRGTACA